MVAMFLKKLISAFLQPMPVCLGLIALGLVLLWWTRRQRAGKVLATVGAAGLALFSYSCVADVLMAPLERSYPPLLVAGATPPSPHDAEAQQARWIVILSGGHTFDRRLPPTSDINPVTLARLVEAVRLKKRVPAAKLVVSGGFGYAGEKHADLLIGAAEILGVPRGDIVAERRTFDTGDEARFIHEIVHQDPFILVTSASHLPRAVKLFRKQGMSPVPSPSDYLSLERPGFSLSVFFPGAGPLGEVERASHEYLGTLFSKLRGQL
jgi:uncharacterized SAM-binding protein YcdF (DUF218 family)